jgi:hypothetical protein
MLRVAPLCLFISLGTGPDSVLVAQPDRPIPEAKTRDQPEVRDGPQESSKTIEPLLRPTLIRLDFRSRPFGEVAREMGARGGKAISDRGELTKGAMNPSDQGWRDRRVTLEASEPVPFWEAVDRLAAAGRVRYRLAHGGTNGAETTSVLFLGTGAVEGGLPYYTGPFRAGLLGVHAHDDILFVRGPWVRVYPSGMAGPADATALASAPPDGGSVYAELQVLVEPGLVCRRDGPLRRLEATDEDGRSLLAPPREGSGLSPPHALYEPFSRGISPLLRVPLSRSEGTGRRLHLLRGAIPVEVGAVETEPALVIPLQGAAGKTFSGAGVTFAVREHAVGTDGSVKLALTGRFDGDMEPSLRRAAEMRLMASQYRVVDARGRDVHFASSSAGAGTGEVPLTFTYSPGASFGSGPPTEFRYYDLRRAAVEVPFEFRDISLP